MKKVALIGDSIRLMGYGTKVPELLGTDFQVFQPDDNCRFSKYTLMGILREWKEELEECDVIHWNNGLWDVLRLFGDEPLTPLEFYENLLPRVYKRIRFLFPNAKVIFALSTAVIEEREFPEFLRYNREIEEYNKIARRVMEELGVEVNDLYSITSAFDHSLYADAVHFNEDGSKILADAVIKACLPDMK